MMVWTFHTIIWYHTSSYGMISFLSFKMNSYFQMVWKLLQNLTTEFTFDPNVQSIRYLRQMKTRIYGESSTYILNNIVYNKNKEFKFLSTDLRTITIVITQWILKKHAKWKKPATTHIESMKIYEERKCISDCWGTEYSSSWGITNKGYRILFRGFWGF